MPSTSPNDKPHSRLLSCCGLLFWVGSFLLSFSVSEARAAIYACTIDGAAHFQDRPCPAVKVEKTVKKRPSRLPLGIHPSWFERPVHAKERAFCDQYGCECGGHKREFAAAVTQAVADALFLDGSWHHYEQTAEAWLNSNANTPEFIKTHKKMLAASCEVLMSQKILRKFTDDVIALLRQKSLEAENRGYDISGPCDQGIVQACEFFDATRLFRQLKSDAQALRVARRLLSRTAELPLD